MGNLLGQFGNDTISGGDGDDTLVGSDGDDSIAGGAGNDHLSENANASFTLTNTSLSGLGNDVLVVEEDGSSIETASLVDGDAGHTIDASGFTGSVTLIGNGGNDVIRGGAGSDLIDGGEGYDNL